MQEFPFWANSKLKLLACCKLNQCLRELAYVELNSILLIVPLVWSDSFPFLLSYLYKCSYIGYIYVRVYVAIYIYCKIILLFIISNTKHSYTKRKLACQVVTHSTTPLSYFTTTKWVKMPNYIYTCTFSNLYSGSIVIPPLVVHFQTCIYIASRGIRFLLTTCLHSGFRLMGRPVKWVSSLIGPLCQNQTYYEVLTVLRLIVSVTYLGQNTLERMWSNKSESTVYVRHSCAGASPLHSNLFAFNAYIERVNFRNRCLPTTEGFCAHNGTRNHRTHLKDEHAVLAMKKNAFRAWDDRWRRTRWKRAF